MCAALSVPTGPPPGRRPAASWMAGLLGGDGQQPSGSAVRMLDIPPAVLDRAYNWVANSTLWFIAPQRPTTRLTSRCSAGRSAASGRTSAATTRRSRTRWPTAPPGGPGRPAGPGDGAGLPPDPGARDADRRPDVAIGYFCHTPWAPPDYFAILPGQVAREVLEGILGADHAGFHAQRWADAFLDCCQAVLGADVDRATGTVRHRSHTTTVAVHPLGVDAAELRARAAAPDVQAHVTELAAAAGGRKLIVRIDRTELSKNIVRGLAAYAELLTSYPQWRGRVDRAGVRLPVPARPARVPRVHRRGAAAGAGRSPTSSAPATGIR